MIPFHKTAIVGVIGASLLALSTSALAADTDSSNAALLRLIEQQNAQIEALKQRLGALEAKPATSSVATSDAATTDFDGDDVDQALLDELQAQLASSGSSSGPNWRRGAPLFRSSDNFFSFRPRGRVVFDASTTSGSGFDARNISGTEMRAARLGAEGGMGKMRYKIDVDFADQSTSVKDAWISYGWRSLGMPMEVFVGNKLKDRSIDGSGTLSRQPFMERNAVASVGAAVNGYYGLGVFWKTYGANWHLGLSISGDNLDNAGAADDSIAYSVRAHWNPIKAPQGFAHVGSWYYYEKLGQDVASINNTPRIGQNFNDNLRVSASSIADPTRDEAYGFELGGVYRNFWAFGEYTERRIASKANDRIDRDANSFSAGWLITGEKPGFSSRSGVWGTTRVLRPVTDGGYGAFELAVRYDEYDFRDAPRGGYGERTTLGVNWYLNDWTRLMLNYVDWKTDNKVGSYQGVDDGNSIGLRAQISF